MFWWNNKGKSNYRWPDHWKFVLHYLDTDAETTVKYVIPHKGRQIGRRRHIFFYALVRRQKMAGITRNDWRCGLAGRWNDNAADICYFSHWGFAPVRPDSLLGIFSRADTIGDGDCAVYRLLCCSFQQFGTAIGRHGPIMLFGYHAPQMLGLSLHRRWSCRHFRALGPRTYAIELLPNTPRVLDFGFVFLCATRPKPVIPIITGSLWKDNIAYHGFLPKPPCG